MENDQQLLNLAESCVMKVAGEQHWKVNSVDITDKNAGRVVFEILTPYNKKMLVSKLGFPYTGISTIASEICEFLPQDFYYVGEKIVANGSAKIVLTFESASY